MTDRFNHLVQFLVTVLVCLTCLYYWKIPEGYWLVLTTLTLMQIKLEANYFKNLGLIFFAGIGLMLHVVISNYVSANVFLLAGYLFTTTFGGVLLGAGRSEVFMPALMINLLGIYAAGLEFSWLHELQRSELIAAGLLVALSLRGVVWPVTLQKTAAQLYSQWLDALEVLQTRIFQLYLKRDYADNIYFYEKELHQARFACFDLLSRLQTSENQPLSRVKSITEWMITLGNLRYRIKDFSTLEVCEKEFSMASETIRSAINHLRQQEPVPANNSVISAFEQIYQTTLQLVTNEPAVFLVFINDLKQLLNELRRVHE